MTSTARTAAQETDTGVLAEEHGAGERQTRLSRWLDITRPYRSDLAICLLFLVFAVWLTHGLWPHPSGRVLALNPEDQTLYEWFLATDSRILHGDFGLLSDRLNAPDGVNMLANTTVIALGTLFAPITLLFGAATTFAVLLAGNLAATAVAWYLLYSRTLGVRRPAATLGAAFCGFAPGMVSQSNSHLHMTAQWLVPVMVWLLVRMLHAADPQARPGRSGADPRGVATSAVGLAVTVTVQVFIGEEVLFLTAFTLAVVAVSYAVIRRALVRRVLLRFGAGLLLAGGLAGVLLAYPIWFQFRGPQSVPNGLFSPNYFSADLASWWAVSPLSIGGTVGAARLTTGPAEYNTFLGWPMLLVAIACAVWLVRRPLAISCTVAGLVMSAMALGPEVVMHRHRSDIEGPYSLLMGLPVVDGALPMRFALALIPLTATVLALAVDRALRADWGLGRFLVPAAIVVAFVPLFPTPLPTTGRAAVPKFITAGHWRDCVEPGGVLVPVPLPTPKEPGAMRWAAAANSEFGLPEGFFIGPYAAHGKASMGTYKQPTSALLATVAKTGGVPQITADQQQQARSDLRFWHASCVVLAGDQPNSESLRITLEGLIGPPTRIADAWTWRVD